MKRRHFLGAGLALAGSSALRFSPGERRALSRVRPGMPGWPSEAEWAEPQTGGGRPSCAGCPPDFDDPAVHKLLGDPFYLGDQPGLTQSSGWLDAWRSAPSAYVVTAESAADVAAAIRFAGAHNLRLVVRGAATAIWAPPARRIPC